MVKCLPTIQETWVQSLGWEASLGEENGNSLPSSCLENPTDRGPWQAIVHRVAVSQTWPSNYHFHFLRHDDSLKESCDGTLLEAQWLKIHISLQRVQVQSLVGELRFCTLRSVAKKKKIFCHLLGSNALNGLGNFLCKGPDIKCFRFFRPHKGSATTIQLCDCNIKAATDSNE